MIIYYRKNSWKEQVERDISELSKYKESYTSRIRLYQMYLLSKNNFTSEKQNEIDKANDQAVNKMIDNYSVQNKKIDRALSDLDEMMSILSEDSKVDLKKKLVYSYNYKYDEIKDSYINYSLFEDNRMVQLMGAVMDIVNSKNEEKDIKQEDKQKLNKEVLKSSVESNIKNNDTLLISEKSGKVILPYTAKEVEQIFDSESGKYSSFEEAIEDNFVRDYSDYKLQFISRYKETMKLAREREKYGLSDSIALATEMMRKRFLHPAIISACRTVDELDVYLDCLDKNELNDFKIFKIEFELYPMVTKQRKKTFEFTDKVAEDSENDDKEKRKNLGTRFKENSKLNLWSKTKGVMEKVEKHVI